MATINLGAIKFNWQGAYAGGTAYAVDDVVSYNGSSYVCILASTGNLPTNATYFEQMSSAGTNGTNGTDLTTTLTTQGDIVYRDGSGLQRLGAGTAGQLLQTGGAGANPSWGTVSSDFVKLGQINNTQSQYISFENLINSSYRNIKVYGEGFYPPSATNTQVYCQLGYGSTPTWTTSQYTWFGHGGYTDASSTGNGSWYDFSGSDSGIHIPFSHNNTGGGGTSFELTIFNINSTSTINKQVRGQKMAINSSPNWSVIEFGGWSNNPDSINNALTSIRFYNALGDVYSGRFTMYGLK